jgi:hypothetical protein
MSSPFSPTQKILILIAAGVALLIATRCSMLALQQRRRGELRYTPATQAALLVVFAAVLVTVACAFSFVNRYVIWLPAVAVAGLAILRLTTEIDENRENSSTPVKTETSTFTAEANEPQKVIPTSTDAQKSNHCFLWIVAVLGAVVLIIELWEVYFRLAIGVSFFLFFVIPAKDRPTVAKLFGLLALWGVPVLWNGLKVAQFLILSALYGIGPVWNGSIRVTAGRHFIRLSNGEEFHGLPSVLWNVSTLVILAIIGILWLRILNWLIKRLYPPMLFPMPA